jgi:MoaE-MoaD fusion protein
VPAILARKPAPLAAGIVPALSRFKPVKPSEYALAMRVVVKLFAALRERAGTGERVLELREGARAADVWPTLGLGDEPAGLLYAVNREYAVPDHELAEGDEVALIPPVSGGAFVVTEEPLSLEQAVDEVADENAGAVATFTGTVRRESRGRTVQHLEYEAYAEMAESVMVGLATVLKARYDLHEIAIHHRVGRVEIGEASVVIAVSAPHRADALAACKDAIDALKETVPLWKKEVYEGGEEWIGRGS